MHRGLSRLLLESNTLRASLFCAKLGVLCSIMLHAAKGLSAENRLPTARIDIPVKNLCATVFKPAKAPLPTTIIATDPSLTADDLAKVARAKERFDRRVFKKFSPTPGLVIKAGPERGDAYQSIFDNHLTFPFHLPEHEAPDYVRRAFDAHGFLFRGEPVFAHEYAHAVLEPYFLKQVPRLASYLAFVEKNETVNRIRQSTLDAFYTYPDEFPLLRAWRLLVPYNEFLADLATTLIYGDPTLPRDAARLLFQLQGSEADYRSFAHSYKMDLNADHPDLGDGQHTLLGPTRTAVWKLYLRKKDTVPVHLFYKAVVRATVRVLSARILSEHHLINVENVGELLSPGQTVQDVNDQLTRKIEAIDFEAVRREN